MSSGSNAATQQRSPDVDDQHRSQDDDEDKPKPAPSIVRVFRRLNSLDDFVRDLLAGRLDRQEAAHEDLVERVAELEATQRGLESRLNSIAGLADDQRSTPEKRTVDLREAMIRAAEARSDANGVTWWWQEVREHLVTLGHEEFSKPTYYTTIEDAAEADGFEETTKPVTYDSGEKRENKAIRVKLDELPAQGGEGRA